MESIELLPRCGFKLLQDDIHFRLGTDSVMLAAFVRWRKNSRVCDLGCGTGALSLLALGWEPTITVDGLEILSSAVELARRNVEKNDLQGRFTPVLGDIRHGAEILGRGEYDMVIANPPYFSVGALPHTSELASARHGEGCSPVELCKTASALLKNGGSFSLVYRCESLVDIISNLRDSGLEPKRLRFIGHRSDSAPKVFLLEAKKGGKPGLSVEPTLILKTPSGDDSPEALKIYGY